MRPAVGRLLIALVLFVGWLGYLGYLVLTRPLTTDSQPLVLSRPQALVSELDVVAHLDSMQAMVAERAGNAWLQAAQAGPLRSLGAVPVPSLVSAVEGMIRSEVDLVEVREALWPAGGRHIAPGDRLAVTNLSECRGFSKPGDYLLLLRGLGSESQSYKVVAVPLSPGFAAPEPRIYPSPQILPQYRELQKP
jgi:hypothetical protein